MLRTFRYLSVIEGLSLIVLLFIAMPARYQFGISGVVPVVGWTHGILFLLYFAMSLIVSHQREWSVPFWLLVLLVAVVPFACFFLDRKLRAMEESAPAGVVASSE